MIPPQDPIECGLPHRAPFVFIDEVLEVASGESAKCAKIFAAGEPFFAGHFPGNPLVPGVILTEAMAQTAGIAAGQPGRTFHLSAIKLMKFLKPVPPESRVVFSAKKTAKIGGLLQFQTAAHLCDELVAEGVIVLSEA